MDFQLDVYTGISLAGSLGTLLAVVVSVAIYFWRKKAERSRASENLYLELKDALASLDGKRFSEDVYYTSIKDQTGSDKTVYFMSRDLNHDFYDSLIYSGKINFLDPSLQQRVQDTFKRIKTHNKYVDMVLEMWERNNGIVPVAAHRYCEWVDYTEKRLRRELPEILQSLQSHFNLKHQT